MTDLDTALAGEPAALSVRRASELLGIPESEVRRMIAAGQFPVVAVGERLMVLPPSLQRWAQQSSEQHRAQTAALHQAHPLAAAPDGATSPGIPCPSCGSPLVPVTSYISARFGRVAACPHSPAFFAVDLPRPLRVYDVVSSGRRADPGLFTPRTGPATPAPPPAAPSAPTPATAGRHRPPHRGR